MIAFAVILILYVVVGLMAAVGTTHISRKIFPPKREQIFYAMFLILIALFYLAFAAYFEAGTAWRVEGSAVLVFVAFGLVGARLPSVLATGYILHGVWDLLHELQAHGAVSTFGPGQLTAIPLAYGVFCLTFDFFVAVYCCKRRAEWDAAWKA